MIPDRLRRSRPRRLSPAERRTALLALSDEDLMSQFQDGAVEAFNILVERFSEPLLRYIHGFSRDSRVCEDLLQETFVRVYRNRHSYRRIAKFSTWIYTIAGNLARSEYRKRKRFFTSSIHSVNRDDEEFEISLPDEQHLPDVLTDSSLQRDYVQAALGRLAVEFREVVVLRDIQQLSYEEIAEITGLPMGTVKSRINRGRTKLQEFLKGIYPFDQGTVPADPADRYDPLSPSTDLVSPARPSGRT